MCTEIPAKCHGLHQIQTVLCPVCGPFLMTGESLGVGRVGSSTWGLRIFSQDSPKTWPWGTQEYFMALTLQNNHRSVGLLPQESSKLSLRSAQNRVKAEAGDPKHPLAPSPIPRFPKEQENVAQTVSRRKPRGRRQTSTRHVGAGSWGKSEDTRRAWI